MENCKCCCKLFCSIILEIANKRVCCCSVTEPETPDVTLTSPEAQNQPHTTQRTQAQGNEMVTTSTSGRLSSSLSSRHGGPHLTLALTSVSTSGMQNLPLGIQSMAQGHNQPLTVQSNLNSLAYPFNLVPYNQGPAAQPRFTDPAKGNTIPMPPLQKGIVAIGRGFTVGTRPLGTGQRSSATGNTVNTGNAPLVATSTAVPTTTSGMNKYCSIIKII